MQSILGGGELVRVKGSGIGGGGLERDDRATLIPRGYTHWI